MADKLDTKARLRAIRKLASPVPDRTAQDRLERIEGIASGKLTPEMGRVKTSPDLMERLKAGQASRSPRVGDPPRPPKKAPAKEEPEPRKAKTSRDRKEKSGQDRSAE